MGAEERIKGEPPHFLEESGFFILFYLHSCCALPPHTQDCIAKRFLLFFFQSSSTVLSRKVSVYNSVPSKQGIFFIFWKGGEVDGKAENEEIDWHISHHHPHYQASKLVYYLFIFFFAPLCRYLC